MKNLTLSACAIFLFLGLTSCSTNESLEPINVESESSLKSYKVQKDINGRYSIDVTTTSGTDVESVKNTQSNSNEIYLYSNGNAGKKDFSDNLSLENDKLAIEFVENSKTKTSFIIEDEDIVLAKGETNTKFLQEYSFDINQEEKTVELDFKVRKGVNVSFTYNEEIATYEIHLKEGKSSELSFSKIFKNNNGNPLKVDFVNHLNTSSRSEIAESTTVRKPKGIIIQEIL